MKRIVLLILTICFCFIASAGLAEDYWMYVRTYDRPTVDSAQVSDGTYGRSKKGDIISFLPVTHQFTPTEIEKKNYAIVKIDNITKKDIDKYTEAWEEKDGIYPDGSLRIKKIANRLYSLDIDTLNIKVGLSPTTLDFTTILKPSISQKTESHLISYRWGYRKYAYIDKPLKIVRNFFIRPAYAAETVSDINGGTEAYNTLTLWEDDKDGDLAGDTRNETASCYDDDGDLTDQFTINDSTTDATYYMKVTSPSAERHDGTDTGWTLVHPDLANNTHIIVNLDNYTVLEWLNITNFDGSGNYQRVGAINSAAPYPTIRNIIIHDSNDFALEEHSGIVVSNYNAPNNAKIYNIIIYGLQGDFDAPAAIEQNDFANRNDFIYNNTAYNNEAVGFHIHDSTCKNNIGIGNKDGDFVFDAEATNDYNASGDASADGANSLNSGSGASAPTTADFVSVTGGSENLHLDSGAVEIDVADDLGSPYDYDIDGDFRDTYTPWDMGADEYVAVAAGRTRRFF